MSGPLTEGQQRALLDLARSQVDQYVRSGKRLQLAANDPRLDDALRAPGAAFVTLRNRGMLRGCIGTILAHEPLHESVLGNAVQACLDPRFRSRPITPAELNQIDIEISVLSPPCPVDRPEDVVVGRDGAILTLGGCRGLFLPQVPTEQGWDRTEYLRQLGRKAGLDLDAYKDPQAEIETFTAQVFGEKEWSGPQRTRPQE
jgi:AmmeMemoRadiSam system protein A